MINGSSSAKNIREATIYGNAQGEMINGSSSAKNIREATIYGKKCSRKEIRNGFANMVVINTTYGNGSPADSFDIRIIGNGSEMANGR
ncbi:unnamed protein product [Rhizophagus irregularis]|nr:unnamed protein product [Rhizophagus irregularis]